jgi:iron-sulfur cluster assembly accessory protein
MGQPGPEMITFVVDEDLGLVLEPAEGGGMDDPVPVALEVAAGGRDRLRVEPAAAPPRIAGIRGSPSLAKGPHDHPRVEALSARTYLAHNTLSKEYVLLRTGSAMTGITLTDRAARRINEIMSAEPAGSHLRISVNGGGCSGFQYAFDVDRTRQDDDLVIERDGATVVVDEVSIQYMDGSVIDFVDDLIGQSFKIENPHATASCGCGTSFSL